MLKKLSQSRIVSWLELDNWLNILCDRIKTRIVPSFVLVTDNSDLVPATILASKLGCNITTDDVPNAVHFSIISNKNIRAANKAALFVCFIETTIDSKYETLIPIDFSIEQITIPFGESMTKLVFPWEKR